MKWNYILLYQIECINTNYLICHLVIVTFQLSFLLPSLSLFLFLFLSFSFSMSRSLSLSLSLFHPFLYLSFSISLSFSLSPSLSPYFIPPSLSFFLLTFLNILPKSFHINQTIFILSNKHFSYIERFSLFFNSIPDFLHLFLF